MFCAAAEQLYLNIFINYDECVVVAFKKFPQQSYHLTFTVIKEAVGKLCSPMEIYISMVPHKNNNGFPD